MGMAKALGPQWPIMVANLTMNFTSKFYLELRDPPVGVLHTAKFINMGKPINCDYRYFVLGEDVLPNLEDTDIYNRCLCLRPNCFKVLRLLKQ